MMVGMVYAQFSRWRSSKSEDQHAGRLFNPEAERHGREPTSRERYEGQAARVTLSAVALSAMAQLAAMRSSGTILYVFAKRTHRFRKIFLIQHPSRDKLVSKTYEEFWWVRFGKRTHFRGCFSGFGRRENHLEAENEHIFKGTLGANQLSNGLHETACQKAGEGGSIRHSLE